MKKVFKILGITLLLIIIVIACLPFLFKGKLLDLTKEEINKSVNAKVNFGNFGVSIFSSFPNLKINLEDVTVVGIEKFDGDTLLDLKDFSAEVDIMSVISGSNIKIRSIILDGIKVNARVLKDSSANWNIAKPSTDTTTAAPSKSNFKMALRLLEIDNAYITYDDRTMNTNASIENLNLELSGDFTSNFTLLKIKCGIDSITTSYGGISYLKKVAFNYSGKIDADMKNSKFTFKENDIKANDLELGINGWFAMPKDDITMDIKMEAKQTDFKTLFSLVPGVFLKGYEDIKTTGKLAMTAAFKGTFNSEKNMMPAFNINLLVKDAMFKYPQVPKPVTNIQINLNVSNPDGKLDNTVVDLKQLHAEFAQNPFNMILKLSTPISDPSIYCKLDSKIDLASLKEFIPLKDTKLTGLITSNVEMEGKMSQIKQEKYTDFKAIGTISLKDLFYTSASFPKGITIKTTDLEFSPQYVTLKGFDSQIGKTDIKMSGKLENFIPYALKNETIKGSLNLQSTLIDANELMSIDTTKSTDTSSAPMTVVEVPGNINFTVTTTIGQVKYDKMDIKALAGQLVVKDSKVDLSNLTMNLLGGSMNMKGTYSTQDIAKPSFDFTLAIKGFDIQKTFTSFNTVKTLAPFAKNCSGNYTCDLSIKSELGKDMKPVYKTMNGNGTFTTKEVVVKNSPTIDKIANLVKRDDLKELKTKDIAMQFTITNGNIEVKPFTTKINNMSATISGVNNLDKSISYIMAMQVPRSNLGGVANSALDGLLSTAASKGVVINPGQNINVDILIGGTMNDPKPSMKLGSSSSDTKTTVTDQVKAKVDEQKALLEQKAKADADKAKADATAKAKTEADKAKKDAEAKAKIEADAQKKKLENEAKNKLNKLFK
jgi:hypothetical protein